MIETKMIDIIVNGEVRGTVPESNRDNIEQVLNNEGVKFIVRPHLSQEEKQQRIDKAIQTLDMESIKRQAAEQAEAFRKSTTITDQTPVEAHPNVDEPPQIPPSKPKAKVKASN